MSRWSSSVYISSDESAGSLIVSEGLEVRFLVVRAPRDV